MEAHLFSFFFCLALTRGVRPRGGPFTEQTPWRNGSASDSKSEGWGFESLWRQAHQRFTFALRATALSLRRSWPVSLWPNWTRRLTTNQKIGGSSPSRDRLFFGLSQRDKHNPRRGLTRQSACSVMVIIGASQALDPGSIPGRRRAAFWGISSIGRVRALQARGTGIETPMLQWHSFFIFIFIYLFFFFFDRASLPRRRVLHRYQLW